MKELLLATVLPLSLGMTACSSFREDLFPRRHYQGDIFNVQLVYDEGEDWEDDEDWWICQKK
jgi:hypothetical protein